MLPERLAVESDILERCIAAFESAWQDGSNPEPADFLPSERSTNSESTATAHRILVELLRVDLEFRFDRGDKSGLAIYEARYPQLFSDREAIAGLAFEEFRLRSLAGQRPDRREYERKYGVSTDGWLSQVQATPSVVKTDVYSVVHAVPNDSPTRFPNPGEHFGSFKILAELGRGSFARVYHAEQIDLAGRSVALKIMSQFGRHEPETLARLQHAHIVPIYSVHQIGSYQATVMPYLGATTLADLNDALSGQRDRPRSGRTILDTIAERHSATRNDQRVVAPPAEKPVRTLEI
ncbi:MAG: hypothetical protein U0798_15950, partial [Gemmataceae bacterium]